MKRPIKDLKPLCFTSFNRRPFHCPDTFDLDLLSLFVSLSPGMDGSVSLSPEAVQLFSSLSSLQPKIFAQLQVRKTLINNWLVHNRSLWSWNIKCSSDRESSSRSLLFLSPPSPPPPSSRPLQGSQRAQRRCSMRGSSSVEEPSRWFYRPERTSSCRSVRMVIRHVVTVC